MGITPERLSGTLREGCRALAGAGVPFSVAGGHAAAVRGHVGETRGIDLRAPAAVVEGAAAQLQCPGFACERQSDAFAHFACEPLPALRGASERRDLLLARCSLGIDTVRRAASSPLLRNASEPA